MLLPPGIPPIINQSPLKTLPVLRFLPLGGLEVQISEACFDVTTAGARDLWS